MLYDSDVSWLAKDLFEVGKKIRKDAKCDDKCK